MIAGSSSAFPLGTATTDAPAGHIAVGITGKDVITFFLAIASFIYVTRQFNNQSKLFEFQAFGERHKMYLTLTTHVTDDEIRAALTHIQGNFDMSTYTTFYHGQKERVRSYVLMKKKYVYLYYSIRLEKSYPIPNLGLAKDWIKELIHYREFHDVHLKHGGFYKDAAIVVDEVMNGANKDASEFQPERLPWMHHEGTQAISALFENPCSKNTSAANSAT